MHLKAIDASQKSHDFFDHTLSPYSSLDPPPAVDLAGLAAHLASAADPGLLVQVACGRASTEAFTRLPARKMAAAIWSSGIPRFEATRM